jgi:hypothetical protein
MRIRTGRQQSLANLCLLDHSHHFVEAFLMDSIVDVFAFVPRVDQAGHAKQAKVVTNRWLTLA